MKTKKELLAMGHEELVEYILHEQELSQYIREKNEKLRNVINAISVHCDMLTHFIGKL